MPLVCNDRSIPVSRRPSHFDEKESVPGPGSYNLVLDPLPPLSDEGLEDVSDTLSMMTHQCNDRSLGLES
jgi:hypothetical protein